uniref:Protein-lysine N-methyltransferase Mettl10 n=1 Tax=Phallusia mammillata TaxID=59560 RepID=A0A6F9DJX1_9ASCI|nr:methyltransferase-like protein 10 [Phallusia mammillata]
MTEENELNSSKLGTFEYWESTYDAELQQFEDITDPGTEWFGPTATKRMVKWITKRNGISKEAKIVDVGCGNGLLLLSLAEMGYVNLVGVDYCANALKLAQEVFKNEGLQSNAATWLALDITQQTVVADTINKSDGPYRVVSKDVTTSEQSNGIFKVCLDKGTYDAISLCPDDSKGKRDIYKQQIAALLEKDGIFLITSCNWTASELRSHFTNLSFVEELPAPTFVFGGKQGKTVSACVFKKS